MKNSENGFNSLPDPEITPDKDTLQLVLSDIGAEAMHQGIEVHLASEAVRAEIEASPLDLSGEELDAAVKDLSADNINDIRESERRAGIEIGMQLIVNRVVARMNQIDS